LRHLFIFHQRNVELNVALRYN